MFGLWNDLQQVGAGIARAVCCFFFTGPLLMVVGIAFLASTSTDSRTSSLAAVNAASATWSATGAAAFANRSLSVVADNALSLPLTTSSDYYPDSDGLTVPTRFAKFTATSSSGPTSGAPFRDVTYVDSGPTSGNSVVLTLYVNGAPSYSQDTVTLIRKKVTTVSCSSDDSLSTCRNRCNGAFQDRNSRQCWQWFKLTAVCYVVDPQTGQFASSNPGCAVQDDRLYGLEPWSGGTVTGLGTRSFRLLTSQPSGSQSFGGVTVTVRSSTDPYVIALMQTGGTLDFGLTTGQKASIGAALLATGIVITVLTCGAACFIVRKCAKKDAPVYTSGGATVVAIPAAQPGMMPPPPGYGMQQPAVHDYYGGASKPMPYAMQMPAQQGGYPGGPPPPGYGAPQPGYGGNPYAAAQPMGYPPQPMPYSPQQQQKQQQQQQPQQPYGYYPSQMGQAPPSAMPYGQAPPGYPAPYPQQQMMQPNAAPPPGYKM